MGTTAEEFFEQHFKEEYHPKGDKHKASAKVFDWFDMCDFAQQFSDKKTTSQEQTIERLREFLKQVVHLNDYGSNYELTSYILKEAEQLLNTKEPIDQ